uniref:Conserved secreted protein n=1 Tax=Elaeophora elaphi TaxID=1147741 RepID=A0A158Q7S0_9BILA
MRSISTTATIILFLSIIVERFDATLKNQTGEGRRYYWVQPYELPQWQTQGWSPSQNWVQPQSEVPSSQGWALPPGGMPVPGWIPSSVQSNQPSFLWTLFDDRNVCTLDASILVVLENDGSAAPVGLSANAQSPSSYYGGGADLSSNADDINGFLINSTGLIAGQFPDITLPSYQRMKRQGLTPPLTQPPLPPVSCVCCGPRRFFANLPVSASNPPPQQM